MERLVTGVVAALLGAGIGVLLSWFVWGLAEPRVTCDLGPAGHCPSPDPFLPYALAGGAVGAIAVVLAVIAVVRTLD